MDDEKGIDMKNEDGFADFSVVKQFKSRSATHVYLSQLSELPVVVKTTTSDAGSVEREDIRSEGKLLKNLNYSNIIKLLRFDDHLYQPRLVLEYLPGGDLLAFINKNPYAPIEKKSQIAQEITKALLYLHVIARVIHCDIKPGNILLDETQTSAKLCDFGFAVSLPSDQDFYAFEECKGTPGYVAPEIIQRTHPRKYSAASDQYAFGSTLFCLFYGFYPFQSVLEKCGNNVNTYQTNVLNACLSGDLPDLEQLSPPQPEPIKKLITTSWSMVPNDRPNKAETLNYLEQVMPKQDAGDKSPRSNHP